MRHRRLGRRLGRSSAHRRALMRNLASALFLTERDDDEYIGLFQSDGKTPIKPPQVKGRIITTLAKAKEVRPFVERCITLAKKAQPHLQAAEEFAAPGDRTSPQWKAWRESPQWQRWVAHRAPALALRRRVFNMLRNKRAVQILFDDVAPRMMDRQGGYTRILRLAKPRLGDAGPRAILELVGRHDRVKQVSQKPDFADSNAES